jgi:hypothetical protein
VNSRLHGLFAADGRIVQQADDLMRGSSVSDTESGLVVVERR